MMKKVSLIIPVYNVEKYIEKCLQSSINQTLNEIEIIIINDGSTDGSLKICENYANQDTRITVITQENAGLSAARNRGIKEAKGEFISFLDSDDYLDLGTLEASYKMAIDKNVDLIIYKYVQVDEDGNILYESGIKDIFTSEEHFKRILAARASAMACDKFYRRDLFINNNITFPIGLYHEDVATIYKLLYFAKEIRVLDKVCYFWLQREGSISKSITQKHVDDFRYIMQDTKQFLLSQGKLDSYYKEYVRRGAHFLLGLIDRINFSDITEDKKSKMRFDVWTLIKELDLHIEKALEALNSIDAKLHFKLDKIVKHKSKSIARQTLETKGESLVRKIADKILPKGSNRREYLKKILGRAPMNDDNFDVTPVSSAKPKVKNMLNVAQGISSEEREKLKTLKNKYEGKRCFIVGNGPSLNKCDLSLLENEYTFAVNGIFYKTEEMGFKPSFYMVEDGHVVDDNLEKINAFDIEYKFFPSLYKEKIIKTDNTYFFAADLGFYRGDHPSFEKPRFSEDFSEVSYCGQSVTYLNMQLAYYLGFKEVYLIGMDFSYQIRETDEVRGQTLVSNEDDVNHFHPDYFGKGKKWHDPKVYNVAKNYEYAKENFEKDGRNIYNATVGGKLEIFERKNFQELF